MHCEFTYNYTKEIDTNKIYSIQNIDICKDK